MAICFRSYYYCTYLYIFFLSLLSLLTVTGLRSDMDKLVANYYVPNSKITRSMQIKHYLKFIETLEGLLATTPCDDVQVGLYITWLFKSLAYSSITNYLSEY